MVGPAATVKQSASLLFTLLNTYHITFLLGKCYSIGNPVFSCTKDMPVENKPENIGEGSGWYSIIYRP